VVENIGDKPVEGILIEPKKPASALPAGARDVMVADPKHHKVEFENDQVRILHYLLEPGETSPTHGHPDNVQVVLTDASATVTTPDGKTTSVTAKAGEVHWRPAGQHTVQNTGKQPLEGVLVEMKGGAAASAK
jgi:quercetin dioxygenase-like cupin family protein